MVHGNEKISRISGALLISMLFSSILSGVVLVIMGALNLPLDMQSIKVICGSIASVGYFYFFRIFTKEIEKININEISLNKKFSVWDSIGYQQSREIFYKVKKLDWLSAS